jgi:hypothetical protein
MRNQCVKHREHRTWSATKPRMGPVDIKSLDIRSEVTMAIELQFRDIRPVPILSDEEWEQWSKAPPLNLPLDLRYYVDGLISHHRDHMIPIPEPAEVRDLFRELIGLADVLRSGFAKISSNPEVLGAFSLKIEPPTESQRLKEGGRLIKKFDRQLSAIADHFKTAAEAIRPRKGPNQNLLNTLGFLDTLLRVKINKPLIHSKKKGTTGWFAIQVLQKADPELEENTIYNALTKFVRVSAEEIRKIVEAW